jgi:hypothetical protein
MSQNLIDKTMVNDDRDAMLADLVAFDTKFTPYKVNLTTDQISKLARLKETDIAQLELAYNYAVQNPTAMPGDVDVPALGRDIAVAKQLVILDGKAQQAADATHASLIAALSDGITLAGLIYRLEKAKGKTPQNQAFLEAYGARYAQGPSKPTPANPPAPPH